MTQPNKPAAKGRSIIEIGIRLQEWVHQAFSTEELYGDCHTLLAAYEYERARADKAEAEVRDLIEENYSLMEQMETWKARADKAEAEALTNRSKEHPEWCECKACVALADYRKTRGETKS